MQKVLQDGYTLTHLDPFNGTTPTGLAAFSNITIGEYFGAVQNQTGDDWHIDAETVLPTNEQAADYLGTVRHEMGHALGIIKNVDCEVDAKKDAKLDPMLNQLAFFTKNFVGDNVTKVLNGYTFDGVSGLPINGWEGAKDKNGKYYYQPEFSHIQTPGIWYDFC
jgi:hypothetical protein